MCNIILVYVKRKDIIINRVFLCSIIIIVYFRVLYMNFSCMYFRVLKYTKHGTWYTKVSCIESRALSLETLCHRFESNWWAAIFDYYNCDPKCIPFLAAVITSTLVTVFMSDISWYLPDFILVDKKLNLSFDFINYFALFSHQIPLKVALK